MARHSTNRESQTHKARKPSQGTGFGSLMAMALTVLVGLPSIAVAQAPLEWAEGRILVAFRSLAPSVLPV